MDEIISYINEKNIQSIDISIDINLGSQIDMGNEI